MQLFETSYLLKLKALFRFLIIRFFFKRVTIQKLSYIGSNLRIFATQKGRIIINGKINIRNHVEIQSQGLLKFGNHCGINSFSRVVAFEKIEIGENVSIAQFVSILDHDHDFSLKNGKLNLSNYNTKPIKIGNNVWIADKVSINKGVTIGDNVVIGANSVVTKDIPSNSIAVGAPARVLKTIN